MELGTRRTVTAPWGIVRAGDRGAVTVEAAIALFTLVTVLALTLAGIGAAADQLRCADAAREAAKLAARGDMERAREVVRRIAPPGARVHIDHTSEGIAVTVHSVAAGGFLPGLRLRGHAFAVPEPGAGVRDAG